MGPSEAFPVENVPAVSTSLKVQEAEPETQGSDVSKQNVTLIHVRPAKDSMHKPSPKTQPFILHTSDPLSTSGCPAETEIQQPSVSSTPYTIGPGEQDMITQWSSDVSYSLSSSPSTLDEEIDVPILFEQSQFSIEEKNDWVHNMCQKMASLPPEIRNHMAKRVAQRHLFSVLEHCFESDEKECIEFLAKLVVTPECNLDVAIRFLFDKANEGSWLPDEGELKLKAKVKAARYLIAIIKKVCDPKRLMYWYDLLAFTYMEIWNKQPRQSEEYATKNVDIYIKPGEIAHIMRVMKEMQQDYMSQMLPDVAD